MPVHPFAATAGAALLLAAGPALAGDHGHRPPPPSCGGCGGHRNVNVNVNAQASAYAEAGARGYLNARTWTSESRYARSGGAVYVGGGGYAEGAYGYSGGYYAPVERLGPAPVSAP